MVYAGTGEILIDGVAFPYWVMPEPEIELVGSGQRGGPVMGALHVGILADNVTFIAEDGRRRPLVSAPAQVESDWARVRAQEIVRDGLSEVIAWIGEGMPR